MLNFGGVSIEIWWDFRWCQKTWSHGKLRKNWMRKIYPQEVLSLFFVIRKRYVNDDVNGWLLFFWMIGWLVLIISCWQSPSRSLSANFIAKQVCCAPFFFFHCVWLPKSTGKLGDLWSVGWNVIQPGCSFQLPAPSMSAWELSLRAVD